MAVPALTQAEMKLLMEILGDFRAQDDEEHKLAESLWLKVQRYPVRG